MKELKEVALMLSSESQLPFTEMTHSFLKRRLSYVINKYSIKRSSELESMSSDDVFMDKLCNEFTINTTELFRSAGMWRALRNHLLNDSFGEKIHVWFPNVSSGDELYCFLILAKEIGIIDHVRVTVSHVSRTALEDVQLGKLQCEKWEVNLHNYKRFEGVSQLDTYFSKISSEWFLDETLLQNVVFINAFATSVIPPDKQDFIIFRDTMIYYNLDYQQVFKHHFDKCLNPSGLLLLGAKELMPQPFEDRFELINENEQIYKKHSILND